MEKHHVIDQLIGVKSLNKQMNAHILVFDNGMQLDLA